MSAITEAGLSTEHARALRQQRRNLMRNFWYDAAGETFGSTLAGGAGGGVTGFILAGFGSIVAFGAAIATMGMGGDSTMFVKFLLLAPPAIGASGGAIVGAFKSSKQYIRVRDEISYRYNSVKAGKAEPQKFNKFEDIPSEAMAYRAIVRFIDEQGQVMFERLKSELGYKHTYMDRWEVEKKLPDGGRDFVASTVLSALKSKTYKRLFEDVRWGNEYLAPIKATDVNMQESIRDALYMWGMLREFNVANRYPKKLSIRQKLASLISG